MITIDDINSILMLYHEVKSQGFTMDSTGELRRMEDEILKRFMHLKHQPEDYLEQKTIHVDMSNIHTLKFGSYIPEDDAYDAVDMAKREIAWAVHEKICAGADISELDKYVTDICDF